MTFRFCFSVVFRQLVIGAIRFFSAFLLSSDSRTRSWVAPSCRLFPFSVDSLAKCLKAHAWTSLFPTSTHSRNFLELKTCFFSPSPFNYSTEESQFWDLQAYLCCFRPSSVNFYFAVKIGCYKGLFSNAQLMWLSCFFFLSSPLSAATSLYISLHCRIPVFTFCFFVFPHSSMLTGSK